MDVLAHWQPTIDWSQFSRGELSEDVWRAFQELVQLCHSHRHWQAAANSRRREHRATPLHSETASARRKRANERKAEISKLETHMHRAAYLAAAALDAMVPIATRGDPETPDGKLWLALTMALACFPRYEQGHYAAAAFSQFRADAEVQGAPQDIATRWRRAVEDRGMEPATSG